MKTEILSELQALHDKFGILKPEDVVECARDEHSPLHEHFEWNDGKAADEYRKDQARSLIRVAVQVLPNLGEDVKVRVFTSLKSDRRNPGGGYRRMTDVLSHDSMRAELLQIALDELKGVREKYKEVKELADVFTVVDAAVERHRSTAGLASPAGASHAAHA
jgi:hypothetical protein